MRFGDYRVFYVVDREAETGMVLRVRLRKDEDEARARRALWVGTPRRA